MIEVIVNMLLYDKFAKSSGQFSSKMIKANYWKNEVTTTFFSYQRISFEILILMKSKCNF